MGVLESLLHLHLLRMLLHLHCHCHLLTHHLDQLLQNYLNWPKSTFLRDYSWMADMHYAN